MQRNLSCTSALYIISILFCITICARIIVGDRDEDIPHHEVKNWALKFGVDLWEFGGLTTKMDDIKSKYKDLESEVTRKDGIILLRELAAEVKNFMEYKMNAVLRIMDSAEQAALSEFEREQHQNQVGSRFYKSDYIADDKDKYSQTPLSSMRRFEQLTINLTHSSILVPSGVNIDDAEVKSSIAWSSHLDPIFINNLVRDSALSWQYFGSTLGFLRRFPGTSSEHKEQINREYMYDFRLEDWFVQAANSPKDIVILLDTSGSISDKKFRLSIATSFAILDSLGDDDYVNVLLITDSVKSIIPCYRDKMIRATVNNINEFKQAISSIGRDGNTNFTAGFENAFELLHKYNQTGLGCQCNQAIMVITNFAPEQYSEIIKHYNWPHMPVRIFTYLISGDSNSRKNMREIACTNKGFFVQINSEEEILRKVIDYTLVMARPMVLYQADHPVHWSPVILKGTNHNFGVDGEKKRLITSVTTPVFDRRNQSIREASLLGVVGTDVPIDEIKKMIPQHKLGVNGYSFIVDNNGRVLFHPDLRPLADGIQFLKLLKPKYSSVDLTDVELPEIDMYHNHEKEDENIRKLLDMRHEMVEQKEGEMELKMLVHMDNMKRTTLRTQRYVYGPIEGTPFSLGISLPDKYGMHELNSQEEIRHSHQNVTAYFKGDNWRVHPEWVYCEYNSLHELGKDRDSSTEQYTINSNVDQEQLSFKTAELQLLHFLARAGRPRWKWMSVRPRSPNVGHGSGGHHTVHQLINSHNYKKAEPYYCDRPLIQSLVRDAMVTDSLEEPSQSTRKEDKQQGYPMFGVKLTFVATRSGLLRWYDHNITIPEDYETNFGDMNANAIDMAWYKRAVDQHSIEPNSFVFSVPFDSGYPSGTNGTTLVTASHAIFVENKGHQAPVAVVGLQFLHHSLSKHFVNITSSCTPTSSSCRKTCASDELDCYLLDNNGFIILAETSEHTGRFFGQIDGTIMDSLVQDRIYRKIVLMDYQGLCSNKNNPYSAAANSLKYIQPITSFLNYILKLLTTFAWILPHQVLPTTYTRLFDTSIDYSLPAEGKSVDFEDEYTDYTIENGDGGDYEPDRTVTSVNPIENRTFVQSSVVISDRIKNDEDLDQIRMCDLKTDLFVLQPERLNSTSPLKGKLTNCHSSGCERPFSVQKIPYSNLILLVVDTLCPCGTKQIYIEPQENGSGRGACESRKMTVDRLHRKRPKKCISYHPEEIEIHKCSRSIKLMLSKFLYVFYTTIIILNFKWS